MHCPQCRRRLLQDGNWCGNCGARLHGSGGDDATQPVLAVGDPASESGAEDVAHAIANAPPNTAVLVGLTRPLAGSRFDLVKTTTTVGRDPRSDVVLDDVSVSRHHAEVRHIGPAYVAADCGSFNGTYVNGIRVSEILLEDLDELQIGRFRIGFFAPR